MLSNGDCGVVTDILKVQTIRHHLWNVVGVATTTNTTSYKPYRLAKNCVYLTFLFSFSQLF